MEQLLNIFKVFGDHRVCTYIDRLMMQHHWESCEQWHVHGPRVQQYLLYSNSLSLS